MGTLLPRDRFESVHAQHQLLRTTPEQSSFLLLCALRFYPDHDPGPVNYWMHRIGDPALESRSLLEGLVDPIARARRRAASLLARHDEPRVHGQLCRVALEDPDRDVRFKAAESLGSFADKDPIYEVLKAAAQEEGASESRIRAIEALRFFREPRCAEFLGGLVGQQVDLKVRESAIDALAETRCEAGVAALIEIALRDQDEDDRDRARAALSHLGNLEFTEFGLREAERDYWNNLPAAPKGRWWKTLGHWPSAIAILLGNVSIHGLALLFIGRYAMGAAFLASEVLILIALFNESVPAWLMILLWLLNGVASVTIAAWVSRQTEKAQGSFQRVLANSLLVGTMLSTGVLAHGAGHWIAGRRRQAWRFFGIEILAILALLSTYAMEHLFVAGSVRTGFDTFSRGLLWLYRYGALILSWAWAASSLYTEERWGRRGPWRSAAHSGVIRALLGAPESVDALVRGLRSQDRAHVRRVRDWLKHFSDTVPGEALSAAAKAEGGRTPNEILDCLARHKDKKGYERVVTDLGAMFDQGGPAERTRAVKLLASYPTEGSIQCLSERQAELSGSDRLRFWRAAWVRPFRGWPLVVKVASVAMALLVVLLIADGLRTLDNPGWPQIKEMKGLSVSEDPAAVNDLAVTAKFLAERYPAKSAEELATLFRNCDSDHAHGLADSLGIIASYHDRQTEEVLASGRRPYWREDPEAAWRIRQARQTDLDAATARRRAVTELVGGIAVKYKRRPVLGALSDAAARGGSTELVAGLSALFDKPIHVPGEAGLDQTLDEQRFQGMVAAMLADSAPGSQAARDAVGTRTTRLAEILRTSPEPHVKEQVLRALAASKDPRSVAAIKEFVLFDGLPAQAVRRDDSVTRDPTTARLAGDLSRIQRDARARAVDSLGAMQTAEAKAALQDLRAEASAREKRRLGLPPELAAKLRPVGREAAVKFDQDARRLQAEAETLPAADRRRKLAEALVQAQAAVEADGNYPDARGTAGSILYALGRGPEALKEFQQATKLAPAYSWAHYMQALILKEQRRYSEAETSIREALRMDPGYPWSYRLLREVYLAQNRDKEAISALVQLRDLYPEVGEIYAQLAFVYHERIAPKDRSAYEQAYQANRKLLEIQKKSDPAQVDATEANLLECSLTTGRNAEVIERAPALAARIANPDWQMAMYLFTLIGQVLEKDNRRALDALLQTETLYQRSFKNTKRIPEWVYDGTVNFLEKRVDPSPQQAALVNLVRAINKTPSSVDPGLFQAVRDSLSPTAKGDD